ncbi:MAG: hypothetical protein U5K37_05035 [Natrialbaceae archaeon]|nr:hypothetical protein [Natrialbaceae archaeon]
MDDSASSGSKLLPVFGAIVLLVVLGIVGMKLRKDEPDDPLP